ncbi:MAG: hypothetical protein AAB436_02775 [Patescibacteria group bacterium]
MSSGRSLPEIDPNKHDRAVERRQRWYDAGNRVLDLAQAFADSYMGKAAIGYECWQEDKKTRAAQKAGPRIVRNAVNNYNRGHGHEDSLEGKVWFSLRPYAINTTMAVGTVKPDEVINTLQPFAPEGYEIYGMEPSDTGSGPRAVYRDVYINKKPITFRVKPLPEATFQLHNTPHNQNNPS